MRPPSTLHHGLYYETLAAEFLIQKQYKIIARNVRYRCGEIDLIAHHQQTLIFVEVRKRDSGSWISPLETVTYPKLKKLKNAIQIYLTRYQGNAKKIRLDFIGVMEREGRVEITHIEHFAD